MASDSRFNFSDDRPLTDRQRDSLNRAPFADRVAKILLALPKNTSFIVGIHGPWGDGKTTILNLLRSELSNKPNAIVVRDYNPWRLIDEEAMLRGFFSMLAEAIGASLSTTFERTRARAGKWARRVRWITKPAGEVSKAAEALDVLLSKLGDAAAIGDSVGLEELRSRITTHLTKSLKRIVILIDDIDRLDNHETHMLFRFIKACADFPNVCYVLAFDDTAVARALGERFGDGGETSGRAFLEKIIQLPLKLPVAAKEDLFNLCEAHVNRACEAAAIKLSDEQRYEFFASFDRGVSIRLTTPRAAKRFGNGLMFALPALAGETNLVDLLLVEALRAFFPEVYNVVRENHLDFSGIESERHGRGDGSPRSNQRLQPLLEELPEEHADAAKALLTDLFPKLTGGDYDSSHLSDWSRDQRISAPDYCPRYFTYGIPLDDVPNAEITAMLKLAKDGDAAAVESRLTEHLAGSKARRVIRKLREIEKTIDPIAAEIVATAMAKLGKNIPNPPSLFVYSEPPAQAAILISHLLRQIPDRAKRIAAAKHVTDIVDPLWFGAECISWLYTTDKPEKQDSNTLTKQETAEVRQTLVDRIKSRAATGAALFDSDIPQEHSQLVEWCRADGREPVQAHLVEVFTKDPKQVATFLQSLTPRTWTSNALPHVSDLGADELKNIKFFIDLDTMAEWVQKHCRGNFDNLESYPESFHDESQPLEQRLAEQFMFVYNAWKKDCKDKPNAVC